MSILKRPVVSEKSSSNLAKNKYTFEISLDANKIQVRDEIKKRFNVDAIKVNVINRMGKKRRRGAIKGQSSDRRFAVVTLADGQEIDAVKGLF